MSLSLQGLFDFTRSHEMLEEIAEKLGKTRDTSVSFCCISFDFY